MCVDSGGATYLAGSQYYPGSPGQTQTHLIKHLYGGGIQWQPQWGRADRNDVGRAVALDGAGNVYMIGSSNGNTIGGGISPYCDALLAKYNTSGSLVWTRELSGGDIDVSTAVALDASGNTYMAGYTNGSLHGANAGLHDAFLAKHDPSGNLVWTRQWGTSLRDYAYSVAVDDDNNIYVAGETQGSLGGTLGGWKDTLQNMVQHFEST